MAVFDDAVKVTRAVADPKNDRDLPSPGALSWGGIKSATGLAGTIGADCKLVTGDMWQQISGSQTENFTGNVDTTIMQNQNHTVLANRMDSVTGNHTGTILGNTITTMVGPHVQTNVGPRNNVFVGPRSELHAATTQHVEPVSKMQMILNKLHYEPTSFKSCLFKTDIAASSISVVPMIKVDIVGLAVKVQGHESKNGGIKTDLIAMKSKVHAFATKTIPATIIAAALYAKVIAADLNGGIAGNGDSPLG